MPTENDAPAIAGGTVPGTVQGAARRASCRATWPGISGANLGVTSTGTCVATRHVIVAETGNRVRSAMCGGVAEVIWERTCSAICRGTCAVTRGAIPVVSCVGESGRPTDDGPIEGPGRTRRPGTITERSGERGRERRLGARADAENGYSPSEREDARYSPHFPVMSLRQRTSAASSCGASP
jgi:hypothetical protein